MGVTSWAFQHEWLLPTFRLEPWLTTNSTGIRLNPNLKFENGLLHFAIEKFVDDWQTSAPCVRVNFAWAERV